MTHSNTNPVTGIAGREGTARLAPVDVSVVPRGTTARERVAPAPCEGLEGSAGGRCGRKTTLRTRAWAPGALGAAAWVSRPMCQRCARMAAAPTDSQAIAVSARRTRVHLDLLRVQAQRAHAISAEARESGDEHAVTMTGIYLANVGQAWGQALDAQLTISDASRRLARGDGAADAWRHAAVRPPSWPHRAGAHALRR